MPPKATNVLLVALLLVLAGVLVAETGVFREPLTPAGYENATVTLQDDDGTTLATVDVRIADNDRKRTTGLSETDSLADGEGMLFVHDAEDTYAYVMREMSFPLDIVFVDANGTVTRIHHAPVEPDASGGELTRYRGRGKYVLEVPRGYTNETDLDVGDTVVIPESAT